MAAIPGAAVAQTDLFAPRVYVNDRVVTNFELEQRIRFLTLLRAPGDIPALAEKLLIEDKLRLDAAEALDITLTDEQVIAGMTEFAARANLSVEQFLEAIAQGGVQPESFRDFVSAGLVWREVVRAKFGESAAVTNAEIDRALASYVREDNSDRVLLSEIVLPLTPEDSARSTLLAKRFSQSLRSEAGFAGAAKKYSAAPSKVRGGRLEWAAINSLPPEVSRVVAKLEPGQVSEPVNVSGAVALFYLREKEKGGGVAGSPDTVEYATFVVPGAGSDAAKAEAQRIRESAANCDELYPVARKLGKDRLTRDVVAEGAVPRDLAAEVARLDVNESSANVVRGNALLVVMVCARGGATGGLDSAPREAMRGGLINQRLGAQAEVYLEELRQAAVIRTP